MTTDIKIFNKTINKNNKSSQRQRNTQTWLPYNKPTLAALCAKCDKMTVYSLEIQEKGVKSPFKGSVILSKLHTKFYSWRGCSF